MTKKERELIELIRANPQITQKEIAAKLEITRSSASVHITNLIKKGYIVGKGYEVVDEDFVTVLGAANVDMIGFSEEKIILRDYNPGNLKTYFGGVARNISENLARLGVNVKLISAIGNDVNGMGLIEECKEVGIDVSHSLIVEGVGSSSYIAIMDEKGELALALTDLSILNSLSPDYLLKKTPLIKRSKRIVVDASLPEPLIQYIASTFKDNILILDPVSLNNAKHVKNYIGDFHTVKLNRHESEYLSGIEIKKSGDMERVAAHFLEKGVQQIYITLGSEGVFYGDEKKFSYFKPQAVGILNSTGAGDAFTAGIVYGSLLDKDMDYTTRFACGASSIAFQSYKPVSPQMSVDNIKKSMMEC